LSNLDTFAVNLRGYRFDDNSASLSFACTLTNDVTIQPGESIVLVENMSPEAFRAWWGPQLDANAKIITYSGSGLSFGSSGDAVNVWNAAASADSDKIASVSFGTATRGVSFGYDPNTQTFGGLSVAGVNGAFVAAVNGDIGSPGAIMNWTGFTRYYLDGAGFHLTLKTLPGRNYRIEYTDQLESGNWQSLSNVIAVPGPLSVTDPDANGHSARFYRAVMTP
jgi:hypothetical protein